MCHWPARCVISRDPTITIPKVSGYNVPPTSWMCDKCPIVSEYWMISPLLRDMSTAVKATHSLEVYDGGKCAHRILFRAKGKCAPSPLEGKIRAFKRLRDRGRSRHYCLWRKIRTPQTLVKWRENARLHFLKEGKMHAFDESSIGR